MYYGEENHRFQKRNATRRWEENQKQGGGDQKRLNYIHPWWDHKCILRISLHLLKAIIFLWGTDVSALTLSRSAQKRLKFEKGLTADWNFQNKNAAGKCKREEKEEAKDEE